MKRKLFNFSLVASIGLLAFGALSLVGCSSSGFKIASLRISTGDRLEMSIGDQKQLKLSVSPKEYANYEARWFTSNDTVAWVTDGGKVTAVGEGTATVTATLMGGYASVAVTVSGEGGGQTDPYLRFSATTASVKVGATTSLQAFVYPSDTSVAFTVDDETVAAITPSGKNVTVRGLAAGTAVVTATAEALGLSATCTVTVSESGGGGESGYDWGIDKTKSYSGSLLVGATPGQEQFVRDRLAEFKTETNSSNFSYTVIEWAENKSADNMATPTSGPHVFPYASDQTLRLVNVLQELNDDGETWISDNMGQAAFNAATISGVNTVVGYPFSSDNGYVMFYDKSMVNESDINTVDKLISYASNNSMEIAYNIADGFFGAGVLMSYTEGKSLYSIKVNQNGSYTPTPNFEDDKGVQGARLMYNLYKSVLDGTITEGYDYPGGDVLAVIADCSKVRDMKDQLGSNYAAAPLPFVGEENNSPRLGVYLGYKFYGMNMKRIDDNNRDTVEAVARFLCSEYVQSMRFEQYYVKPTMTSLDFLVADEPHVKALNTQSKDKSTIPLTAVDSGIWDALMATAKEIKGLADSTSTISDSELKDVLIDLDVSLGRK